MKVKYKITEVRPKIFHVAFKDQYDMCMTFLKAQETYESPNPKFRNHVFSLEEFMRWYSKTYGNGSFTYPNDWGGFNVPSYILDKMYGSLTQFGPNTMGIYEFTLFEIYCKTQNMIAEKYGLDDFEDVPKFYLIGTLEGAEQTIHHEVAHGYFYTNKDYKKEMTKLVNELDGNFRKSMFGSLAKIGYTKQVFIDETQAYLSTGWSNKLPKFGKRDKKFIEVFKAFDLDGDHK